ncbi:hypothetical protein LUZ61_017136 [Rhynchospora tenuis]|uniref:F-box domain-containing protein n=1 Tax=Rhynchospora tenuis TaxID=198213 RepID=A0AAD5Z6T6_9POAL|nr:hypothetical protein LUZ61_017136 [Rhynchospora tenuis]
MPHSIRRVWAAPHPLINEISAKVDRILRLPQFPVSVPTDRNARQLPQARNEILPMTAAEPMGEADRISALPEEIKISILSRLHIKYAIRTSALAHSWRHLWTHLSYLDLSDDAFVIASSDWIERAHHLVSSLRAPLVRFELRHSFHSNQAPLVQPLLDLLLQKGGVETLNLTFFYHRLLVHLPPFHSLKVLQLYQCHVLLPTGFQGFRSLTTLELKRVRISNDHLNFLIHTSNNLTTLLCIGFVSPKYPLSINISLPLLRHLKFVIDDSIDKVSVISAPCLEQVEIMAMSSTDSVSQKLAVVILGLLISVAMVSSLHLHSHVLKCLSLATLPFNLNFPRLRSLIFYLVIGTMDKSMYDAFFRLLRSMSFVEELELTCCSDRNDGVEILMGELFGKKRDGISCLNQTLKSVTINMDNAIIGVILGKFFLLKAKVLKLMKFECYSRSIVELGMLEELQKAEVTSSDAKVVIFCHEENVTINIK